MELDNYTVFLYLIDLALQDGEWDWEGAWYSSHVIKFHFVNLAQV